MINLDDKYALLENGEVEPLFYSNGEPRDAYKCGGVYYLDHDIFYKEKGVKIQALRHDEILMTSNDYELLDKIGKALGRQTEEEKKKDWRNLIKVLEDEK